MAAGGHHPVDLLVAFAEFDHMPAHVSGDALGVALGGGGRTPKRENDQAHGHE